MLMNESQPDSPDPELAELSPWSPPTADLETMAPQPPTGPPGLWGPWATIGWTVLCILVLYGAQLAGLIIFLLFRTITTGKTRIDDLATSGNYLAFATLLSTPATVGFIALLVWLRGYPIRGYLALRWPPVRSAVTAFLGLAVVLVATDLTSYLTGRPLVPTVMVDFYRNSWLPGLLFAMVVLAPLGEETLFRGFLYAGITASRAGPIVAIIVSTVAFAALHVQYDWYGIAGVAAIGLYLGVIRFWTRSLFLTMILHGVANVVATLDLLIQEHWLK
jgi:membrane protease YdiL (CAAX protease family)